MLENFQVCFKDKVKIVADDSRPVENKILNFVIIRMCGITGGHPNTRKGSAWTFLPVPALQAIIPLLAR